MDFLSPHLLEKALESAPHYVILCLLVWWFLRGLTKSNEKTHDKLIDVAQQSATAIGQNSECLRALTTEIRGLNGTTRQPARNPVTVPPQDTDADSVTSS